MIIRRDEYAIRPWRRDDNVSLAGNANNIKIWNNVRDYFPNPYSIRDADDYINLVSAVSVPLNFAIEIAGKAVGGIGFVPGSDVERLNAEIGYWLGEKYWNRGIMSSVVRDSADYIFANSDFIRLFAPVFEFNSASMRVLEKAGFNKIAVLHKAAVKNNRIIDLHYYELLK